MEEHAVHHVLVRESSIKGAGTGLFAERTFCRGECITSYRGCNVTKSGTNNNYSIDFRTENRKANGRAMVMQANPEKLYLGAHFANDREHNCRSVEERKANHNNRMKRQNNAEFSGITVNCAIGTIFVDQEITISYNIKLPATYSSDDKPKKKLTKIKPGSVDL